jgi:hypothetical protein
VQGFDQFVEGASGVADGVEGRQVRTSDFRL